MKTMFAILVGLFAALPAQAMISGYFMSVGEIQAIVASPEVEAALGSAYRIGSITSSEVPGGWGANYEISAKINTGETCKLPVGVSYVKDPTDPFSPGTMKLSIGTRSCLP